MEFGLAEHSVTSTTFIGYIVRGLAEKGIDDITEIKVQKLAYMVYGFYLAATKKRIVTNEKPIAYPSGPIFQTANYEFRKTMSIIQYGFKEEYDINKIEDKKLKQIIIDIINSYGSWSSKKLVARSYLEDSPRTKTRKGKNTENERTEIEDDLTYNYFIDKTNKENIFINKRLNITEINEIESKFSNSYSFYVGREGGNIRFPEDKTKKETNIKKIATNDLLSKNNYEREIGEGDIKDELQKRELQAIEDRNSFRRTFVKWVIYLVSIFLGISLIIVTFSYWISDSVKITLLSSTTATIIGLPLVIVRGLFEHKDKKKKFKKKKED